MKFHVIVGNAHDVHPAVVIVADHLTERFIAATPKQEFWQVWATSDDIGEALKKARLIRDQLTPKPEFNTSWITDLDGMGRIVPINHIDAVKGVDKAVNSIADLCAEIAKFFDAASKRK